MEKVRLSNREPDWDKLNEKFNDRRGAMNRFYEGLVAKRDKTFKDEESLKLFNEKRDTFQGYANKYFEEWLLVLASLSGKKNINENEGYLSEAKEIFKNITIQYTKWDGHEQEFKRQATITFSSSLPFGPFGFIVKLIFSVETNPASYAQEFRLTAYCGNELELTSEREKQTLLIHSFNTAEQWKEIGYDRELSEIGVRRLLIEMEIYYYVLTDFLFGIKTYRNVDFLMSTKLPR